MGKWVNINELGTKACTKVQISFLEMSAGGKYWFSTIYGDAETSCAYFELATDVGAVIFQDGGMQEFSRAEGIYGDVVVDSDLNVWWEWTSPMYYYGYEGNLGSTNNMDFLVWVEEDTEGGDTETDTETITSHLQRIIQAKADIKSALLAKGCDVGDGTIDTYAAIISNWTPS